MCTLPSELPVMEMSPEVLLSSRGMGPLTLRVRSRLPVAAGPMAQRAPARAATSNVRGAVIARLGRILPPRVFVDSALVYKKIRRWRGLCSQRRACSRALWLEGFVQGALAIAFEVEGDVGEPGLLEGLRDGGRHFRGERARHFFGSYFDAREFVVQSDAELLEAEIAEGGFAALDEAEALGSDFGAIGHAGGEARGGGAIPGGKSGPLGEMADFGFAQAGVEQRREDAML